MVLGFGKKRQQPPPQAQGGTTSTPGGGAGPMSSPEAQAAEQAFRQGTASLLDIVAPASFVINANYVQIGSLYVRTLFAFTYPRYVQTNWLSAILNYDITMDVAMYIYPQESQHVMSSLRRKVGQLESSLQIEREKGLVRDPELETAIEDIEGLRDVLQKGESKLFQFSLYMTIYAPTLEQLNTLTKQLESTLGGMLVYTKRALVRMEQGFQTTLPLAVNELDVRRNLDTGSLSTTFPFVSADLSSNEGILYGLNRHNNSLVLFDRFNLENANSVVFAKSGAGKSYAVKLDALRSIMIGVDVVIIDPESEYKTLAEAVGGSFFPVTLNSEKRINPFDLPPVGPDGDGESVLRSQINMLTGLVRLMVAGTTPEEDALIERALFETYQLKDITADAATHKNQPPLLADFQSVLQNMSGAQGLLSKLEKYVTGTFAGLFNQPTNFQLDQRLTVFSVRDLEEQLRPIGIYLVLSYIWNKVRFEMKKRILIVDEAWWMMQFDDSARFLYAIAKRGRKYYLGLTIISQDVEDFLDSKYGRAVITNSSMQLLMKQSTSAVDKLANVFNLTDGEKFLLLEADVGEGLFFAGQNHAFIKIISSYTEDQIITSDPQQIMEMRSAANPEQPPQEAV